MDMLLVILMAKKLLEHFTRKNYKKQNKNNLGQKNQLKEKVKWKWKDMIIHLIVGWIKRAV